MKELVIHLDDDLQQELEAEAARSNVSASDMAAAAIRHMLQQRAARRAIIDAALAEAERGAFISEEAMTAWFESLGTEEELPPPQPDVRR